MVIKAREVLSDCEEILAGFNAQSDEGLYALWRPKWAGLVALLRSVGHVLDKVDGEQSPQARDVIDKAWADLKSNKPEPKIFWEFIKAERDNVLKMYQFGTTATITIWPGLALYNFATGESGSSPSGPTTFEYFMRSGAFESQNPLELCRKAIQFWNDYLERIEAEISETLSNSTG